MEQREQTPKGPLPATAQTDTANAQRPTISTRRGLGLTLLRLRATAFGGPGGTQHEFVHKQIARLETPLRWAFPSRNTDAETHAPERMVTQVSGQNVQLPVTGPGRKSRPPRGASV